MNQLCGLVHPWLSTFTIWDSYVGVYKRGDQPFPYESVMCLFTAVVTNPYHLSQLCGCIHPWSTLTIGVGYVAVYRRGDQPFSYESVIWLSTALVVNHYFWVCFLEIYTRDDQPFSHKSVMWLSTAVVINLYHMSQLCGCLQPWWSTLTIWDSDVALYTLGDHPLP